jgi:hypothetical protein
MRRRQKRRGSVWLALEMHVFMIEAISLAVMWLCRMLWLCVCVGGGGW